MTTPSVSVKHSASAALESDYETNQSQVSLNVSEVTTISSQALVSLKHPRSFPEELPEAKKMKPEGNEAGKIDEIVCQTQLNTSALPRISLESIGSDIDIEKLIQENRWIELTQALSDQPDFIPQFNRKLIEFDAVEAFSSYTSGAIAFFRSQYYIQIFKNILADLTFWIQFQLKKGAIS